MCCNTITPKDAESAVKTIRKSRHACSQSCDTHPQQQLPSTLTLLKQMNVEKVWSVDQKKDLSFSHGCHHCSKKLNMPRKDDFIFTQSPYFKFFLLQVFHLASHAPSKFGKLFESKISSSIWASSSRNYPSSFLSRYMLLTLCILSGKHF